MLMRYHWSMGVGHTYSHAQSFQTDITWAQDDGNVTPQLISSSIGSTTATRANQEIVDQSYPAIQAEDNDEEPDPNDPQLVLDEQENEDLGQHNIDDDNHNSYNNSVEFTEADDDLFEMYHI